VGITVTIKVNFTVQHVTEAACLSALLIFNFIKAAVIYNPLIKLGICKKHYFPKAKEQQGGKDPTISP